MKDSAQAARRGAWLGLGVVGFVFLMGAAVSWRKWPDILIDFGLQLYLPWKLSTGSVLYKDVAYLPGGPLSQYFNAGLFRVFGVSLLTLVVSNLLITAGLVVLVYRRFLRAADAMTATMICLGIVVVSAFAHFGEIGNYNFITPYSHEVFHGLVLSIVAVMLLAGWIERERIGYAAGAGFCGGLVFLTKPEVFAALALCAGAALVLFWVTRRRGKFLMKSLAAFSLVGLVPLAGFLFYFHRMEDWHASFRAVIFAWVPLLEHSVQKDVYYRWCLGLDAPGLNLRLMVTQFLVVAAVTGIYAFFLRGKRGANKLLQLLLITPLFVLASRWDWTEAGRALPLLGVTLCVLLCVKYKELAVVNAPVFPLLWGVFALGLLAKLGLFSRIWHYGFALAMPAFAGAVYLLLWLVPWWLEKYGVQRRILRATFGAVLMLGFVFLFMQSALVYRHKTLAVGGGADRMLTYEPNFNLTGAAMRSSLEWLEKNAPPGATLAVLPEGAMVNYLSRRTNPTPYLNWSPPEVEVFGLGNMTAAVEGAAPDYIMLVQRDSAEYGLKFFGQQPEYGQALMQWIERNYEAVGLFGEEPLKKSAAFGIKILKRRASQPG